MQRLFHSNKAEAQRYLSSLIKPKIPLQLGLRNPDTGEELSKREEMRLIEDDILGRSGKVGAGDPKWTSEVQHFIKQWRAQSLSDTASDDTELASLQVVSDFCQQL